MSKKVIFEDATMAYNRWTQGIASREFAAGKVTLFDLFDKYNKQFPNDAKDHTYIPPTLTTSVDLIGNILNSNSNFRDKIRQTHNLPYCTGSERRKKIVENIYKKTYQVDKIMQSIVTDLDELVEKPKNDDNINSNEKHS